MSKELFSKAYLNFRIFATFWAEFLYITEFIEDSKKTKSMGVVLGLNKIKLFYNEEFVKKLSLEELQFALLHEMLHVILRTFARRNFYPVKFLNIVSDKLINYFISTFNFKGLDIKIIDDVLMLDKDYPEDLEKNLEVALDYYYNKLPDNFKNDNIEEFFKNEISFDDHFEDEISNDLAKTVINNLIEQAKLKGNITSSLQFVIDSFTKEKFNIDNYLKFLINEEHKELKRKSWSKRNRKFLNSSIILQGNKRDNKEINIIIDISGSISDNLLKRFFGFVDSLKMFKLNLYLCDTVPSEKIIYKSFKQIKDISFQGRGGTIIRPAIEKIIKDKLGNNVTILFTDGFIESNLSIDGLKNLFLAVCTDSTNFIIENGNSKIVKYD